MVREFVDIRQASIDAVRYIIDTARAAVRDKGYCTIVLAGGSTPQLTYELLAEFANTGKLPVTQCHFFWGDERWVDPSHPDSNLAMAAKAFFSKVQVSPSNIHPIPTAEATPEIAAEAYESHLRDFFASMPPPAQPGFIVNNEDFPAFDLMLLGMGPDGHTVSLFPGSPLLTENKRWAAAVPAGIGSPPVARITLTLPVLNQARNVLFLISGTTKRTILETILSRPKEAEKLYPAALVKPAGNLVWLVADKN